MDACALFISLFFFYLTCFRVTDGDDQIIDHDVRFTTDGIERDTSLAQYFEKAFVLLYPVGLVKCGVEVLSFFDDGIRIFTFVVGFMTLWCLGVILKICPSIFRTILTDYGMQVVVRLVLRSFSGVVRFHNPQNRPETNTIAVANHTTPFDWVVLASDVSYAVIGQKHSGFFGLVERMLSSAIETVWFDREEVFDRIATSRRLRQHVTSPRARPLLIFPEGTCINNTSVMKFKKGCFEVGAMIHPMAVKYNPLFADCFWNSSQDGLFKYLVKMMTSWAIVVDVWYLPPTKKRDDENPIAFTMRVQKSIADRSGLLYMDWDGDLKRRRPKDTFLFEKQKLISEYVLPNVPSSKEPPEVIRPSPSNINGSAETEPVVASA